MWREGSLRGPEHPSDSPPCRPEEAGAEVPLLPLDTLHVLAKQLDEGDLEQALLLLKLLIILCRWVPVVLPKMGGVWNCGPEGVLPYCCDLSHRSLPRNLENVDAGRGQVLAPRLLALLTRLVAEVRWALPGGGRCAGGTHHPANPLLPCLHTYS